MTFSSAPWAIDGATISSALARRAQYAATRGSEGIVEKTDLKVSQLAVPGNGVLISAGNALILNRYQSKPNETYVIANPGTHSHTPAMPWGAIATPQSYFLAITIGDPEFPQVNHNWMPSRPLGVDEAATFQYVVPIVISCPAGATKWEQLGLGYPGYALARLDIPANTTTITNSMITDLRAMAQPRTKEAVAHTPNTVQGTPLNSAPGTYMVWPVINVLTVTIPPWATVAKINGFIEGARLAKAGINFLRFTIAGKGKSTSITNVDEGAPTGAFDRRSYNLGGEINVSDIAGQTVTFQLEGSPFNTASQGSLTVDLSTSVFLRVLFEEIAT